MLKEISELYGNLLYIFAASHFRLNKKTIDNNITSYLSISLVELNFAKIKYDYMAFVQSKLYVHIFVIKENKAPDCRYEQIISGRNFCKL